MKRLLIIVIVIAGLVAYVLLRGGSDSPSSNARIYEAEGPIPYSLAIPDGWYAHPQDVSVIFTMDEVLDRPQQTEGYALGESFIVIVHDFVPGDTITTYEDWLDLYGFTESNPLYVSSENVVVNGLPMLRVVSGAAGAGGNTLTYVYFADIQRIVTLYHYPYVQGSEATQAFESAVRTFSVEERQQ